MHASNRCTFTRLCRRCPNPFTFNGRITESRTEEKEVTDDLLAAGGLSRFFLSPLLLYGILGWLKTLGTSKMKS